MFLFFLNNFHYYDSIIRAIIESCHSTDKMSYLKEKFILF